MSIHCGEQGDPQLGTNAGGNSSFPLLPLSAIVKILEYGVAMRPSETADLEKKSSSSGHQSLPLCLAQGRSAAACENSIQLGVSFLLALDCVGVGFLRRLGKPARIYHMSRSDPTTESTENVDGFDQSLACGDQPEGRANHAVATRDVANVADLEDVRAQPGSTLFFFFFELRT